MGRDDGDIGWGHGRKATTHSLTLYAVKLLGNDFVTLLVPQRSPPLPPFQQGYEQLRPRLFFRTGNGQRRRGRLLGARLVACILRREGASASALSACR